VLGGLANICYEYATKRYRSNCINWGIVPFTISDNKTFNHTAGDWLYIPGLKNAILSGKEIIPAHLIKIVNTTTTSPDRIETIDITLECKGLSEEERKILSEGCLMNYYAAI